MIALRFVFEPTGLIAEDPQLRPADTLLMAPPSLKPNSWRKFPRLALGVAVTSPVLSPVLTQAAMKPLSVATSYAERKRGRNDIGEHCVSANLGYEPIVFESFGVIDQGGMILLSNLCEKVDAQLKRRYGISRSDCLARLSVDLQRGLHGALNVQCKIQTESPQGAESLEIFLHLCLE